MMTWNALNLQNAMASLSEAMDLFHDYILFFLVLITVLVGLNLLSLMTNKYLNKNTMELQSLEFIWTIAPGVVLLFLGIPSLQLLYETESSFNTSITVKVIGHQWYWSYELTDFNNIEFDSYMIPTSEIESGMFRLLEVDNRLVLPFNTPIRFLVTAADVLHSWAVPSLAIKMDATPGRLNQIFSIMKSTGLFYGQCSEICGSNHSFMPIVVESTTLNLFKNWVKTFS